MISGKSLWFTQYHQKYNALWEPSRFHDAVEGQFLAHKVPRTYMSCQGYLWKSILLRR